MRQVLVLWSVNFHRAILLYGYIPCASPGEHGERAWVLGEQRNFRLRGTVLVLRTVEILRGALLAELKTSSHWGRKSYLRTYEYSLCLQKGPRGATPTLTLTLRAIIHRALIRSQEMSKNTM